MLNSDYKIVTKLLSLRFNQYAAKLIHPDQNGFIAGRQLVTNTHYLTEALDYFETQRIPALVLLLDAEKAFDLVVCETLFIILEHFGIPLQITSLIRNLYSAAVADVVINTAVTGLLKVKRGTRQGCPLSPVLFAFFIEPLEIAIRNCADICPPIPSMAKLKLYADDIMLMIKPKIEVQAKVFQLFEDFKAFGGLRINRGKTEILQCGGAILDLNPDILSCINTNPKRYLRVYFSESVSDLYHLKFVPLLWKIQALFSRWNSLPLSILGRVALIKMPVLLF